MLALSFAFCHYFSIISKIDSILQLPLAFGVPSWHCCLHLMSWCSWWLIGHAFSDMMPDKLMRWKQTMLTRSYLQLCKEVKKSTIKELVDRMTQYSWPILAGNKVGERASDRLYWEEGDEGNDEGREYRHCCCYC